MSLTTSPNMLLPIPTVGSEPGPQFGYDINTSLTLIDYHDHSSGKGVQITPSGLNISSALSFQGQNATNMGAVIFQNQSSLATLNALYTIGGELWFNDGTNPVQITLAGSVNATSSSLTSGTASAAFSAGVLVVDSVTSNSTPGNIQVGSVLLGNNTAGSNFLTLQPPSLTGGGYTLTLPTIPASTSFLTIDATGVIGEATGVSAAQIASASITGSQLANQTVTATQIANGTITTTQIASNAGILSSQLANANGANTTVSGTYSNNTTSFTSIANVFPSNLVSNRPLYFVFSGPSIVMNDGGSGSTVTFRLINLTDNITYYTWTIPLSAGTTGYTIPISSFNSMANQNILSSSSNFALQAKVNSAASASVSVSSGRVMSFFGW